MTVWTSRGIAHSLDLATRQKMCMPKFRGGRGQMQGAHPKGGQQSRMHSCPGKPPGIHSVQLHTVKVLVPPPACAVREIDLQFPKLQAASCRPGTFTMSEACQWGRIQENRWIQVQTDLSYHKACDSMSVDMQRPHMILEISRMIFLVTIMHTWPSSNGGSQVALAYDLVNPSNFRLLQKRYCRYGGSDILISFN